jgi:hypothetical protein
MTRQQLSSPTIIKGVLFLQIIPLILFPASSFSLQTQEWWLPVLLVLMVLAADIELVFRKSIAQWPWYLISFAQGFNIISRLMMLMPHATNTVNDVNTFNTPYIILTTLSMVMSAILLWYTEWPEVRLGLVRVETAA